MDSVDLEYVINVSPDKPGYFISLEDIVLSHARGDSQVPIWDVQQPEYMEFMVYSRETTDNNDDEYENSKTQRCHLCDVDVPNSYFDEHISSAKHKICSAITEISLERVKRQMALPTCSYKPHDTTYFCPNCACSVLTANRDVHNNSRKHIISKNNDYLLNTFCLLYKDLSNYEKVCDELKTFFKVASDEKVKENSRDQKDFNENKSDQKDCTKIANDEIGKKFLEQYQFELNTYTAHKIEYINVSQIRVITKSKATLIVGADDFHGFTEISGKTLCCICEIVVHDRKSHMNDGKHLTKLCANIEDKHCIRKLDATYNHCVLCNEVIENPEPHILTSEKHRKALERAYDDSSELRQILVKNRMSVTSFNENIFLCDPCQFYIDRRDIAAHIDSEAHKNAATKKTKRVRPIKNQKNYCDICKTNYLGKKSHNKTLEHKYLKWFAKKDQKLHHHFQTAKYNLNVFCKICAIDVPNTKTDILDHFQSSAHQCHFRELLEKHKMKFIDEKTINCYVCGKNILFFEDLKHINKKIHRKKIAYYAADSINDDKVKHVVPESNKLSAEHNNSQNVVPTTLKPPVNIQVNDKTSDNISDIMNANQISRFSEGRYACKLCKLIFLDTELNYHINKETHKEILHISLEKDNFDNDFCSICNVVVPKCDQSLHKHSQNHRYQVYMRINGRNGGYQFNRSESCNKYKCRICDVDVDANGESTRKHLNNDRHLEMYKLLKQVNCLEDTSEKFVTCQICNVRILLIDELSHVNAKKHKNKLKQSGRGTVALSVYELMSKSNTESNYPNTNKPRNSDEENDIELDENSVKTSHGHLDAHDVNLAKIDQRLNQQQASSYPNNAEEVPIKHRKKLHYVYEFNDLDAVTCKICKIKVDFCDMLRHRNSNNHKQNFREELKVNSMFRFESYVCFCECCREIVELSQEYAHFTSDRHLAKLSHLNMIGRMEENKVRVIAEDMFFKWQAANRYNVGLNEEIIKSETETNAALSRDNPHYAKETPTTVTEPTDILTNANVSIPSLSFVNSSYISVDRKSDLNNSEVITNINDMKKDVTFLPYTTAESSKEKSDDDIEITNSDDSFASAKTHINESQLFNSAIALETDTENEEENQFDVLNKDSEQKNYGYKHLFRKTKNINEVLCEICDCAVANEFAPITQHINDVSHCSKHKTLLNNNHIVEINERNNLENIYFCEVCNIILHNTSFLFHIADERHRLLVDKANALSPSLNETTRIQLPVEVPSYFSTRGSYDKDPFYMTMAMFDNAMFINEKSNLLSNISPNPDAINTKAVAEDECYDYGDPELIKSNLKYLDLTDKEKPICNTCKLELNVGSLNSHLSGKKHKQNVQKYNDTVAQAKPSLSGLTETKKSKINCDKPAGVKSSASLKSDFFTCVLCNTQMFNAPHCIESHLSTKKHLELFKMLSEKEKEDYLASDLGLQANLIAAVVGVTKYHPAKTNSSNTSTSGTPKSSSSGCNKSNSMASTNNSQKSSLTTTASNTISSSRESIPKALIGHWCSLCELYIPNNPRTISMHNQEERHLQKVKKVSVQNVSALSTSNSNKLPLPFMAATQNLKPTNVINPQLTIEHSYTCHVCQIKIPNTSHNIIVHNNSNKHKENVKALAVNYYKCTICDMTMPNNPATIHEHKEGDIHKNATKIASNTVKATTSYTCSVCQVNVPNKPRNIDEHNKGDRHKENLSKLNIAAKQVTSATFYTCRVCNVQITNNPNNIYEHNQGSRHKENEKLLAAKNKLYECTICNVIMFNDPINISSHDLGDKHKENVKKLATKQVATATFYTCQICNVKIPNHPKNINDHNQGYRHKGNEKLMVTKNKQYECTTCNVLMLNDLTTINLHNEGAKHKANIDNAEKIYTCHICNVDDPNAPINIKGHIEGKRHKDNVRRLSDNSSNSNHSTANTNAPVQLPERSNVLTNKILKDDVGNAIKNKPINASNLCSTANEPTASSKNQNNPSTDNGNKAEKTSESDSEDDGKYYICKSCNVLVKDNPIAIKIHNNTYKHHENIKEVKKNEILAEEKYFCDVCKVEIRDESVRIKEHNNSNLHKRKFNEFLDKNMIKIRDDKICYCAPCDLYFNKLTVTAHITRDVHRVRLENLTV